MPQQRHLFILDPLDTLHPALDTSLRLAHALVRRGHAVFAAQPWHLSWQAPRPSASIKAARLMFEGGPTTAATGAADRFELTDFTAVHMRKDPPFDLEYLAATWELESVADRVHVFNRPRALRELNEKLAIFRFPQECRETLVSADPDELLAFVRERAGGDAVLKPLTLFGGRGVLHLQLTKEPHSADKLRDVLLQETDGGRRPRLVQAFDRNVFNGEVRAFTVGGEPLAWCLKHPAEGQFLANTRAGARLVQYQPTPEEVARVTRVARALWQQGVALAGFDLIGGYITEINLTSPRLLWGEGDERDYFTPMADWVERNCVNTPAQSR